MKSVYDNPILPMADANQKAFAQILSLEELGSPMDSVVADLYNSSNDTSYPSSTVSWAAHGDVSDPSSVTRSALLRDVSRRRSSMSLITAVGAGMEFGHFDHHVDWVQQRVEDDLTGARRPKGAEETCWSRALDSIDLITASVTPAKSASPKSSTTPVPGHAAAGHTHGRRPPIKAASAVFASRRGARPSVMNDPAAHHMSPPASPPPPAARRALTGDTSLSPFPSGPGAERRRQVLLEPLSPHPTAHGSAGAAPTSPHPPADAAHKPHGLPRRATSFYHSTGNHTPEAGPLRRPAPRRSSVLVAGSSSRNSQLQSATSLAHDQALAHSTDGQNAMQHMLDHDPSLSAGEMQLPSTQRGRRGSRVNFHLGGDMGGALPPPVSGDIPCTTAPQPSAGMGPVMAGQLSRAQSPTRGSSTTPGASYNCSMDVSKGGALPESRSLQQCSMSGLSSISTGPRGGGGGGPGDVYCTGASGGRAPSPARRAAPSLSGRTALMAGREDEEAGSCSETSGLVDSLLGAMRPVEELLGAMRPLEPGGGVPAGKPPPMPSGPPPRANRLLTRLMSGMWTPKSGSLSDTSLLGVEHSSGSYPGPKTVGAGPHGPDSRRSTSQLQVGTEWKRSLSFSNHSLQHAALGRRSREFPELDRATGQQPDYTRRIGSTIGDCSSTGSTSPLISSIPQLPQLI